MEALFMRYFVFNFFSRFAEFQRPEVQMFAVISKGIGW